MRRLLATVLALSGACHAVVAVAASGGDYTTKPTYGVTLPPAENSFTTSADAFGTDATGNVDGFPLRSKLLTATGSSLLLQKNFGASRWVEVGKVVGFNMDPSFVKISPSSAKIALGTGFYKPLYVFPTGALSAVAPPDVGAATGSKTYDLSYYDAAWRDDRYLFVNSGTFDSGSLGSAIFAVDTEATQPSTAVRLIVKDIPGASGGVTFDHHGNLITGNGYTYSGGQSGTGELKIWAAADVAKTLATEPAPLDYLATGHVLAANVLSAASLGVDSNNNLYVGGGDAFGGSADVGYAGVIDAAVLQRALAGGAPLNRANSQEFTQISPDPCKNDDATSVLFVPGVEMLSVSYFATTLPPSCAPMDASGGGKPPQQQLYFPPGAPDTDGDGVPDGADNAYQTPNPDQADGDGDGYGDVADCDEDNDDWVGRGELSALVDSFGKHTADADFDPRWDLDESGVIDREDFALLKAKWGKAAVCE